MRQRGFVTIACGDKKYYRLAHNLLLSYKYQTNKSLRLPWCIIADKEDEITADFDDVLIIPNLEKSYMSKIRMLKHPIYKENIFIDADSLIYGDINYLFQFMKPGVRHFGYKLSLDDPRGWFKSCDIGKWTNNIEFKILSHGGIIFYSDDELTKKIYTTCLEINKHYYDYKFNMFPDPADEPIMALSMCIHKCTPIKREMEAYVFLPQAQNIKMNIRKQILSYESIYKKTESEERINNVKILHWANTNTDTALYHKEVNRLSKNEYIVFLKYVWDLILNHKELKTIIYNLFYHK